MKSRADRVAVAGDQMTIGLGEFRRRVLGQIEMEQEKVRPDTRFIDLMCEAVRLSREHEFELRRPTGPIEDTDRWQDQRIVHAEGAVGDCFRACVASVMRVPIDDVPHFVAGPKDEGYWTWWVGFMRWCARFSFSVLYVKYSSLPADEAFAPVLSIAMGDSPRGEGRRHAVVWAGEEMLFDPHPSRAGLAGEPDYLVLFVPVDAGQWGRG